MGLSALGGIACGSSSSEGDTPSPATTTPAAQSATTTTTTGSSRLSEALRAVQTAADEVPDGRPYDLETEDYEGERVWDIKVASGQQPPYELYVSADGKKVVRRTRSDERGDDPPKALQAEVSFAETLRTAGKRAEGRLTKAEIDRTEGGTVVWTATFEQGDDAETEVVIDADSGKVIRTKDDD